MANRPPSILRLLLACLALLALLVTPWFLGADDTTIYTNAAAGAKPMVTILIDNSLSMDDTTPYDHGSLYPGSYPAGQVYRNSCLVYNSRGLCTATAWSAYVGPFTDLFNNDSGGVVAGSNGVDDSDATLKTGNRLNYEALPSASKLEVAKTVLNNLVDIMADRVDFGFAKFQMKDGANIISKIGAPLTAMHGQINAINANANAPLAEALTTVGQYHDNTQSGQPSPWTTDNWCRKGFVIVISAGKPSYDTNPELIGHFLDRGQTGITDDNRGQKWDQDGDYLRHSATLTDPENINVWVKDNTYGDDVPQTFLPDVAKYLYHHDLRADLPGNQNLTSYAIGYTRDSELLKKTAVNGGGRYYRADSAAELQHALLLALDDIAKKMQTFAAPVVPVTRSASGDRMYLAFFKPLAFSKFWTGDLQKFGLAADNTITDKNNAPATDSAGNLLDTASPYWSADANLQTRATPRQLFTYLGSDSALTQAGNAFVTTNAAITAATLGNPQKMATADPATAPRDDLINYLHGRDAYNDSGADIYTAKREKILGDVIHSVPLVVDYAPPAAADPQRYIYFAANDGMIHCVRDSDGSEVWGFIPAEVLPQLKQLVEGASHPTLMDASVKLYEERSAAGAITRAVIIFGQRAGGRNYYALDVTDPAAPQFLWHLDQTTPGFAELGQSWSDPLIGKVLKNDSSGTPQPHHVAIFAGGFDPAQAGQPAVAPAATGRGVFLVDVFDGSLVASFVHTAANGLNYAIPSMVAGLDKNSDGFLDKLYVGDLGGNLWRLGPLGTGSAPVDNWLLRRQFAANPGLDGGGRKFFYPPDIAVQDSFDYLFFGSGDRDNPTHAATANRLYGIKDQNLAAGFTTLTEADLADQTAAPLSGILPSSGNGWLRRLTLAGEQSLATPVLFNGFVLFGSFIPADTTCSIGGTARTYAVKYLSGAAAAYAIGAGIPTEAVLVVRASGTTAFVGAGGGVINLSTTTLANDSPNQMPLADVFRLAARMKPISWRELF